MAWRGVTALASTRPSEDDVPTSLALARVRHRAERLARPTLEADLSVDPVSFYPLAGGSRERRSGRREWGAWGTRAAPSVGPRVCAAATRRSESESSHKKKRKKWAHGLDMVRVGAPACRKRRAGAQFSPRGVRGSRQRGPCEVGPPNGAEGALTRAGRDATGAAGRGEARVRACGACIFSSFEGPSAPQADGQRGHACARRHYSRTCVSLWCTVAVTSRACTATCRPLPSWAAGVLLGK